MQNNLSRAVTVTIPNPTAAQMIAIAELMEAGEQNATAQESTTTKRTGKKTKPATTVSDDEDEDFGKKTLKKKDLIEDDEDELEASDDDGDTDTDDTDDEETESTISYEEVKAALNKYGEKHPDQARAILMGFKIKSPKELSAKHNEKHWEGVYRKCMAKIKAAKKSK